MDVGRFFENMPGDYKTHVLSVVFIFPMAYIDCWKLSPGFAELELLKQVILAAGIAMILMLAGEFLNVGYLNFSGYGKYIHVLSLPIMVTPAAFGTVAVVLFGTNSALSFFFKVSALIICGFGIALFSRYSIGKREKKENKAEEKEGSQTDNASGDVHQDCSCDKE